jgi:hypothetical protein
MKALYKFIFENKWTAWFWTFVILVACTWPGKSMPEAPIVGFDKIVHISMFLVWTTLWHGISPLKPAVLIITGMLYGLGLEFYQQLLPFDRTFDWWDALADAVGVLMGYGFKTQIMNRYRQRLY